MRLFAQLSWYFRREWQRYLGAVALLIIIAILQLIPPKVVGYVVDGVTEQHYTTARVLMWVGTLVLTAVIVYLLRYVWRVLLLVRPISWPLSCVKILPPAEPTASRILSASSHRGSHCPRDQRRRSRGLCRRGRGADAGGLAGDGLCGADRHVHADQLAINPARPAADADHGAGDQSLRRTAARALQAGAGGVFFWNDRTGEHDQHPHDQSVWLEDRQSALFAADAADTGAKTCVSRVLMRDLIQRFMSQSAWQTCLRLAAGAGWWCRAH